MSKNDITGDRLVSKGFSEQGRANFDRIFGKKKPPHQCPFCGSPSWNDPSEQSPPADYCHYGDHGELTDGY